MEFNELKRALAEEARNAGICQEWEQKILTAPSKPYLLRLFLKGSDFVLIHDFPSRELRDEFLQEAPRSGVYLTGNHTAEPNTRAIMAFGASEVTARYDQCAAGEATATDRAAVNIAADDYAYVLIKALRQSNINIKAKGHAQITVFRDPGATVNPNAGPYARIKIIDNPPKER